MNALWTTVSYFRIVLPWYHVGGPINVFKVPGTEENGGYLTLLQADPERKRTAFSHLDIKLPNTRT